MGNGGEQYQEVVHRPSDKEAKLLTERTPLKMMEYFPMRDLTNGNGWEAQ